MKNKYYYIYLISLFFIINSTFAQEQNTNNSSQKGSEQNKAQKPNETTNHPLEFPSMTVEGKEQLKVQSGVKQYPIRVQPLSPAQIDSISPVHKQQALLIPAKPLISNIISRNFKNNYLNVFAGNFLTLNADAGLQHIIDNFTLGLDLHAFYTDGHIKNAEEFDAGFNFDLSYLAPRKYWIFGGSKVKAFADLNVDNYNMYAMDTAFGRKAFDFDFGIKSDGEFQGFQYSTGASYDIFNINHNNDLAENSNIKGFLSIRKLIDTNIVLLANGSVRFGTSFGTPNNFINFNGGAQMKFSKFIIDMLAGVQSTGSTDKIQRANLAIIGNVQYLLNKLFTISAGVNMNFEDYDFRDSWEINKFIEHKSKLDFPYERAIKAAINFHPNEITMFSAGLKLSLTDRFKYFLINDNKIFNIEYADASGFNLFAKGSLLLNKYGDISAEINYRNVSYNNSNDNSKLLPNIAPFDILLAYNNDWGKKIGTKLEINYIGKRYEDMANQKEVNGFINLAIKVSYKLLDNLTVYLKGDNLLNQNRYFWGPYRDRDLFLSVGALWQF